MPIPAGVKFKLRRGFKGDHKLLENNVFQYFGPTPRLCSAPHSRGDAQKYPFWAQPGGTTFRPGWAPDVMLGAEARRGHGHEESGATRSVCPILLDEARPQCSR
jgi:hypothetical protein